MRSALIFAILLGSKALSAQDTIPHTVVRTTVIRTAPVTGVGATPVVGQVTKGATVDVIGKDHDWVRVRVEGWVRESDLVIADSTLAPLSAADVKANPAAAQGKLVQWDVQAVALETADALRSGLQTGESYLLALGPGAEKTLVYIAVPPSLLQSARSLPPMADVTITARVRNGHSDPAGVPILDLQSLTRR